MRQVFRKSLYLILLLIGSEDQITVAVDGEGHTPSHFSVFKNALTYVQVLSEHLQGDLSIVDSALTLFAFGRAGKCCISMIALNVRGSRPW